jgi:hypothetical protein
MRAVRGLLAVSVLLCLAVAGTASANHQEPQKRLAKADNARARAMLVKRADLPGFGTQAGSAEEIHVDCPAAVSESDLTLTGEAEGRQFESGPVFVGSGAQVYESVADADASWRRSTSAAGLTCARLQLRRNFEAQGVRLRSLRSIAFPRVSERTVAYRATLSATSPQGTVPAYVDLVGLMHGRAHVSIFVGAALVKPTKSGELRLARIVAGRMKTAMRGS